MTAAMAAPAAVPATRLFPSGFEVLCTAVHPSERERLQAVAAEHGIQLVSAVRKQTPPHVVVTRSVRSPKYRAVIRASPGVPVVTPDWLLACARQGRRLPYDPYRVGPFTGLTLCFSGISAARKQALAAQVAAAGGAHSAALDKKCSHLVTVSTESDKYKFARREGIICVRPDWVKDCLDARCWLDEAPYLVVEQESQPGQIRGGEMMPLRQGVSSLLNNDEATMSNMPSAVAPSTAEDGGGTSEARVVHGSEPSCGVASRGPADAAQAPQRAAGSRLQRTGSAAAVAAAAAVGTGGGAAANLIQLSPFDAPAPAAPAAPLDDLDWDDDTPMFLDSCRIHLAGCLPDEQREMLRVVREGAAKRFAVLAPGLTHIVVGSDLTAVEATELQDYAAANRQAAFVSLDWLRRCGARRERLPADDRFLIPASRLSSYKRKAEQLEPDARQRSGSVAPGSGEEAVVSRQPSTVLAGPLAGCYFTLTVLKRQDPQEEPRVRDLIQRNGGRLFTEQTISIVSDKSKAFAICPTTLLPLEVHQLRNACPDFRLVDEQRRFTPYWLECSLAAGMPLPAVRAAPLYQPLPFALPLPGMEQVFACYSGYEPEARETIARTVQVLGGRTSDTMTRANTHLILPLAAGAKYASSGRLGVVPVTADWLIDAAMYGRLLPEEHYAPAGHNAVPAGQAAAAAGGAGGGSGMAGGDEDMTRFAGAAGPNGGGLSQIGVTQFPGAGGASSHPPLPTSLYQAAMAGDPWKGSGSTAIAAAGAAADAQNQPLAAGAAVLARAAAAAAASRSPHLGGGSRQRPSLRDRVAQACRGGSAAGNAGPGALRQSNDENVPTAAAAGPSLIDAAVPMPAWEAPWTAAAPRSLLDDALEGIGGGRQPPSQQQPQQQREIPLFDQIFGSSTPNSAGPQQPSAQQQQPRPGWQQPSQQQQQQQQQEFGEDAATAAAAPPARSPISGIASSGSGRRSAAAKSPGRPGSRRTTRGGSGLSRLRPDPSALAAMAVAEAAIGHTATGSLGAEALPGGDTEMLDAERAELGSVGGLEQEEQQQLGEGEGEGDIASMVDRIGGILARVAPEQPMLGSQQDMPPPPPRMLQGSKRRAGGDTAECTMSSGSGDEGAGGSEGRLTRTRVAKRAQTAGKGSGDGAAAAGEAGGGRQLRRSGRGVKAETEAEPLMSQQVGYEASPTLLPARITTRSAANSADMAAKQRLRQMADAAAKQRGTRSKDILTEMGFS